MQKGSLIRSSRRRVPLEGISLRTKKKASQNRYRDARYSERRIGGIEVDCSIAERHQYQ
jgi:hypothetical protein